MDRDLWWEVVNRARGKCEAKGEELHGIGQVDHWLSGVGRRTQKESLQTVWLLCLTCHDDRTANRPDAKTWNGLWEAHCQRYGYPFTPHKELFNP